MYQIEDETVEVADDSEESAPVILLVNKIIDDAVRLGRPTSTLNRGKKKSQCVTAWTATCVSSAGCTRKS